MAEILSSSDVARVSAMRAGAEEGAALSVQDDQERPRRRASLLEAASSLPQGSGPMGDVGLMAWKYIGGRELQRRMK